MNPLILTAMAALLASPEVPQEPTAKEKDPGAKIICKGKRDKVFGSNTIGRGTCKTAAEWKEMEIESKRQLQRFKEHYPDPGRAEGR